MINPGSIARDGYLTTVLSIAVSGYLGALTPVDGNLSAVMGEFVPAFTGTYISPVPASIDAVPTDNYEICAVSGFRALPGTLVYDEYTREKVLPEFADPADTTPRRFGSTDTKKGPLRPEQDDTFIDTPVDPDDF